jgi:hypothetical protein
MNLLLGYGFSIGTTGFYIEQALSKKHDVTFVGTSNVERPGYSPALSLDEYKKAHGPADAFIYMDSGYVPYAPTGLEKLQCPTIAYMVDAWPPGIGIRNPYIDEYALFFDYMFVAHIGAVEHYKKLRGGAPTFWLPAACDSEIHADHQIPRIYDVGFIGSINKDRYPERIRILDALSTRYKMNDYRKHHFLHEMTKIYSQSKIVVNISHTNHILPLRFFEAPASGALLLTSKSDTNGQSNLLRDGEDFVSFDSLDDLLAKIDFYLSNDEKRNRIAQNGKSAVLTKHTYQNRMAEMIQVIQDHGLSLNAPARTWSDKTCAKAYARIHSMLRMIDPVMDNNLVPVPYRLWQSGLAALRKLKHQ